MKSHIYLNGSLPIDSLMQTKFCAPVTCKVYCTDDHDQDSKGHPLKPRRYVSEPNEREGEIDRNNRKQEAKAATSRPATRLNFP